MIRSHLLSVARGFLMGSADLIPGVSGGTIALMLGIYERLISSVKAGSSSLGMFIRGDMGESRRWFLMIEWPFMISLLTGILLAIASLSIILESLLETAAVLMAAFFGGLVAGSTVVAWAIVKHKNVWHFMIAAIVGIAVFTLLGLREGSTSETVSQVTDPALWVIFTSGAVAICAMILPGISGSFILVLLGTYGPILTAVTVRDFTTLLIFTSGAVVGLSLFSQLLHRALTRHHDIVIASLVGLMCGSLRVLWPWPNGVFSTEITAPEGDILSAVLLAAAGFLIVVVTARFARQLTSNNS